ncbi:MAG TPA: HAD-IA family hydrolase [Gaiellaceae bacterium]
MTSSARAVVFDLFGTLIDDAQPSDYARFLAETARALNADPEGFRDAWEANDVARYTGPIEACFESICADLGIADYRAALALRLERMRTLLVPRPDAVETLSTLRERGLRLGMISNASSELSVLWQESQFAPLFDATLFSADEQMMKPDRRLYRRMAELLGVEPADCMFVGDGAYRELQGAAAVGMTPVLIRVPHDEWEHEGAIGWTGPRVSALSEVLALV